MGADLIIAALVIDNQGEPDFKAGHRTIERLGANDIDVLDEFADDDPKTPEGLERIRAALGEDLDELRWSLDESREVDWIDVRGATVYLTGGISYGDSPTDLFKTISRLRAAKGVLRAVGFENEP